MEFLNIWSLGQNIFKSYIFKMHPKVPNLGASLSFFSYKMKKHPNLQNWSEFPTNFFLFNFLRCVRFLKIFFILPNGEGECPSTCPMTMRQQLSSNLITFTGSIIVHTCRIKN